jgi:pyruvate dehydrogenase E2 component (dihydrolipoamide acetyltransferase)
MRDVNRKGLAQLEEESQSLVERARAGRCLPEEFSGGTFTLANLGRFGIDSFTPLVPLSEGAVLGVGRIKTLPFGTGDQVIARQTMWLSLSFDRRLVDAALAARFVQRVVQLIEHPYLLLS